MRFLYFPGCKIADTLPQYDKSLRLVFSRLDIDLENADFNCCGYPVRHQSVEASFLSAARNFAIADKRGLDMITPCKCCFGNLSHALYWLNRNRDFKESVQSCLLKEGLRWTGKTRVFHLLQVLKQMIGPEKLKAQITRPLEGLTVAAHYGCHALRPSNVVNFDNPAAPVIFEDLIRITGAAPVVCAMRTECCGHPISDKNQALSLSLAVKKQEDARRSGADVICTACTYCQLMFEHARTAADDPDKNKKAPAPVLYTQLLGSAMGMDRASLGLESDMCMKTN